MTNKNRALGNGLESRVVTRARKRGLEAAKQPGSGVYADYPNDVTVHVNKTGTLLGECKVRSTLPSLSQIFEWLDGVEGHAKRRYRGAFLVFNQKGSRKPKVTLDLDLFLDLLESANRT